MLEPGTVVRFVGDEKQSSLRRGMEGTVVRVRGRGVDVLFAGRQTTTTGIASTSLEVVAPPTLPERVASFARAHSVAIDDPVAVARAAIDVDDAAVYAAVYTPASNAGWAYLYQLRHTCESDAVRCVAHLWGLRLRDEQVLVEAATSAPCFKWCADRVENYQAFDVTIRTLAEHYTNQHVSAATGVRTVLEYLASRSAYISPDLADLVFRVFSAIVHAPIRDAVVHILMKQHDYASATPHEPCAVCAETNVEPVTVYTHDQGGPALEAGTVCVACFQRTTVTRTTMWGSRDVFCANTTGQTLFVLNRQPVAYVLFKRRLYTYHQFVLRFNQTGIGTRLRHTSVHRAR